MAKAGGRRPPRGQQRRRPVDVFRHSRKRRSQKASGPLLYIFLLHFRNLFFFSFLDMPPRLHAFTAFPQGHAGIGTGAGDTSLKPNHTKTQGPTRNLTSSANALSTLSDLRWLPRKSGQGGPCDFRIATSPVELIQPSRGMHKRCTSRLAICVGHCSANILRPAWLPGRLLVQESLRTQTHGAKPLPAANENHDFLEGMMALMVFRGTK